MFTINYLIHENSANIKKFKIEKNLEQLAISYRKMSLVYRVSFLKVKAGSIAEKVGLRAKDSLVKIGNDCALDYTIDEAMESLKRGKDFFDMIVER